MSRPPSILSRLLPFAALVWTLAFSGCSDSPAGTQGSGDLGGAGGGDLSASAGGDDLDAQGPHQRLDLPQLAGIMASQH